MPTAGGMLGQLSVSLWPGLCSQGKVWAGRESGDLDISGAIPVKAVQHAWQDGEQADAHP